MKSFVFFFTFLSFMTSFSLRLEQTVNLSGETFNKLICTDEESFCRELCQETSCELVQPFCRNCISTNQDSIDFFLLNLEGLKPKKLQEEVAVIALLQSARAFIISPEFIYNSSRWFSPTLRLRFQKLCHGVKGYKGEFPIIFTHLTKRNEFSLYQDFFFVCTGEKTEFFWLL